MVQYSKYYPALVSVSTLLSLFDNLCVWSHAGAHAHVFVFIVWSALTGKDHLSNHEARNQVIHEQNGAWASHDEWMNSLFHRMFQLLRTINTSWGRLYVLAATNDFSTVTKGKILSLVMHNGWSKCLSVCAENTRPMCDLCHCTRPSNESLRYWAYSVEECINFTSFFYKR